MIELKLPNINSIITFQEGESIKTLSIANINVFYNLYLMIKSSYDDAFYLTVNNIKKTFFKSVAIISDIFQLNENDKNNIKLLYKDIESKISIKQKDLLNKIDQLSSELMFDISLNSNKKMEYETKTNIIGILELYKYRFCIENYESLFDLFLNYLKALDRIKNNVLIITFDFLHYFDDYHLEILKEELIFYNIKLLDIKYVFDKKPLKNIDDLFIDNDLCEY